MRRVVAIVVALFAGAALPVFGDTGPPAIDVFVHVGNGATRLSASELADMYNGSRNSWGGGSRIVAFNLPPSHPLRVEFDRVVLDMSPDEVGRYWIDQRIRGGSRPPRQVDDAAIIVKLVGKLPNAIGYAPAGAPLNPDVRIIARIRNRKVIAP